MCGNIEKVKLSDGKVKFEKEFQESLAKGAHVIHDPSYFNKMVWMKANYKSLTEGCEDITAIWPSFGVTSVRIGQVREKKKSPPEN